MLEFCDKPYRYFPPRYNRLLAWVLTRRNRGTFLPSKKIVAVEPQGIDGLRAEMRPGDRLLFTPNHPTHADAAILLEALWQAGLRSKVMAAYDVFMRGRLDAWAMQALGAFSVDREGSDSRAMKEALATLAKGDFGLTIFPEGNVYLENDVVTPFHEGAAFIALKAAAECVEQKQPGRVLVVPLSIKATHATDVRPQLTALLRRIATAVGCEIESGSTPLNALKHVGLAALRRNLEHRGIECPPHTNGELRQMIESTAGQVVARLEAKLKIQPKPADSLVDRIRRARRAIHEVRTDETRAADHAAAATWADEAMVAMKIASYSGKYVTASPTLDRIGETIEKLYEDVYSRAMEPVGPRHALVRFNRPIDVSPYVADGRKPRQSVRELTAAMEGAVQDGLLQLNAGNPHPGAALWNESIG